MCSFATIVSTDIHRIEDTMYNFSRYQAKELALAYMSGKKTRSVAARVFATAEKQRTFV